MVTENNSTQSYVDNGLTAEEAYERDLEKQIEAAEAAEAANATSDDDSQTDVSTVDTPESTGTPEDESGKASTDAKPADDKPVDEPAKTATDSSTDDSSDDKNTESSEPSIPISRFNEVNRQARKDARALREAEEKLADSEEQLKSYQEQAEVQGFKLTDPNKGFTEDDRAELSDELGDKAANALIAMQKQVNEMRNSSPSAEDSSLQDAIDANETASKWLTAANEQVDDSNWLAMKEVWAENESKLLRDYSTDDERIAAVVKLTEEKRIAAAKSKIKPDTATTDAPTRSLNDISGKTGNSGNEVDQILALPANQQLDAMLKIESSDPAKYERIQKGLAER